MRKKKNTSETGAKKLIRPASGPGCSFSGMTMPIFEPVTRLRYFQVSSQPFGVCCFSVGDIEPCGKSTSRKSVVISRRKSRTCVTFSPRE